MIKGKSQPLQTNNSLGKVKKPSLYLFLSEFPRACYSFVNAYRFFKQETESTVDKKNPVLVLPGFMGTDLSTSLLRKYIQKLGFKTYGWGLGRNLANLKDLPKIQAIIDDLYRKHKAPIILIGWSLGGVYARHLAKNNDEKVDQLITLGSPYMGVSEPNRAHLTFRLVKKGRGFNNFERKWMNALPQGVSASSVAIYSKRDGIVSWKVCHEAHPRNNHQNIEVSCGHFGMGTNKEVFESIKSILVK